MWQTRSEACSCKWESGKTKLRERLRTSDLFIFHQLADLPSSTLPLGCPALVSFAVEASSLQLEMWWAVCLLWLGGRGGGILGADKPSFPGLRPPVYIGWHHSVPSLLYLSLDLP